MNEKPAFIQGLCKYKGKGLGCPASFDPPVSYQVPSDVRAQTV